jgi:hypothetical protein
LAAAAYGLHALAALAIILWTPPGFGWKCLIVGSSLAFLALPPMIWRLLECTHQNEGSEHDRKLLNFLVGLWLAYSAIFASPAGAMNNVTLAGAAIAVIVFAAWARQKDPLSWQSSTNIVLAAVLLAVAVVRWGIGVAPLVCFWIILLVGIAVAIVPMWSLLYRPQTARSAASS